MLSNAALAVLFYAVESSGLLERRTRENCGVFKLNLFLVHRHVLN